MGTFAVVSAYIQKIALVLMPLAGMMLIFYSAYQLWKDLRGAERKKIRERLREEESRKKAKKIEMSIAKQTKSEQSIFDAILGQISLTQKLEVWIQQAGSHDGVAGSGIGGIGCCCRWIDIEIFHLEYHCPDDNRWISSYCCHQNDGEDAYEKTCRSVA